tara:strand:- start:356 stop:637 length:282 start_codon:yes stop_codon:yes gene_type:complete
MSKKVKIDPSLDEDILIKSVEKHEIILFNDDVNTFQHVIETLVKVCKHTYQQAEQCAYIVHFSGKCVVKTGSLEKLIPICTTLLEAGLSVEIT